jgi:hypothetical protein
LVLSGQILAFLISSQIFIQLYFFSPFLISLPAFSLSSKSGGERNTERERDKKEREFKRKARGVYVKTPSSSALSLSLSLSGFHIPKTRSFHISFAKMISLNRSSFLVILTKPISQIILSSTPTSPKKKKKKKISSFSVFFIVLPFHIETQKNSQTFPNFQLVFVWIPFLGARSFSPIN